MIMIIILMIIIQPFSQTDISQMDSILRGQSTATTGLSSVPVTPKHITLENKSV